MQPPPKRELDLFKPVDFAEALRDQVPRPFIFGPIEFSGLDRGDFPAGEYREFVSQNLSESVYMPANLCIHGFKVTVKNKTLKRASTIVKHSRYMNNMVVYPVFPIEATEQPAIVE